MHDNEKTREQLLAELSDARERLARVEAAHSPPEGDFRQFVVRVPVPCILSDANLSTTYCNHAAEEVFGRNSVELVGHHLTSILVAPGDRDRAIAFFEAAAAGTGHTHALIQAVRNDGSPMVCEWRATRLLNADASFAGLLCTAIDVTAQRAAQDALRESDDRFRAVADALPAPIYIFDGERLLFANEAVSVMAGYSREDILAPGYFQRLVHPDDLPVVAERAARRLRGESVEPRYETRLVRKNGEVLWVQVSAVPITFEGRPASLAASADFTEQKHTEDALRQSEARLRAILELALNAVVGMDSEGRITDWNPRAEAIFGWSKDEALGRLLADTIIPEQHRDGHRRGLLRFLATGEERIQNRRIEITALRRTGEEFPVELAITPLKVGETYHFAAFIADITARKRADDALRDSEARFRAVVDAVPAAIFLYADERVILTNESATTISGYSREEILAPGFPQRSTHPEDFPVVADRAARRLRGEPVEQHYQYRIVRKDGQVRWIESDGVSVTFDGRPANLIASVDITGRKLDEDTMRESEALFRAVVDTVPAAIWIYNGERWAFANEAASVISGYSHEELLAPGWLETTLHPADVPATLDRAARRLRGEPVEQHYETRLVRKDGQLRWLRSDAVSITFAGHPASLVVSIDITDTKRADEERRKLDLQVQHAQKLESLGVLAGGIAHDFNNLLVAMLGNAGLALMELPPESPARETVHAIEIAAQRAAELTRQMLAYSGKGRFFVEPLNLSRLVEEMGHLLEVSVSKRAIVKYHFAPDTPLIEADATQVRQVVMNLITNASDAIGDRSGVIAISTGMLFADHAYLSETYLDNDLPEGYYSFVEVADTGVGMDEETRSRIFDPFFTTKFTGRGLGLAAVLGIVRSHRGAIKIYTELGRGTTFKVLFPALESSPLPEPELDAETSHSPGFSPGTILVVDDDETVRAVTRRMLEYSGYTVVLAPDGREALTIFQQQRDMLDLVLLDMTMPHMDGEATFRELRRIDPGVRVVLMSGYNEADATEQFSGKGLAGFIQKPFRTPDLLAAIRAALA